MKVILRKAYSCECLREKKIRKMLHKQPYDAYTFQKNNKQFQITRRKEIFSELKLMK